MLLLTTTIPFPWAEFFLQNTWMAVGKNLKRRGWASQLLGALLREALVHPDSELFFFNFVDIPSLVLAVCSLWDDIICSRWSLLSVFVLIPNRISVQTRPRQS